MFTFCTRTVYLGADFYSTNARTFIFSNANVDSLSVDISMDLPQILGRQRLAENPWRNEADLFVTLRYEGKKSDLEFEKHLEEKDRRTEGLLRIYNNLDESDGDKEILAFKYESDAKNSSYKSDFVAVNRHDGKSMKVILNNLVRLAEIRAFEIQTIDYANRFTVLSAIRDNVGTAEERRAIDEVIKEFNSVSYFQDKMRILCEAEDKLSEREFKILLGLVPTRFSSFIITLGTKTVRTCKYREGPCETCYQNEVNNQNKSYKLKEVIQGTFSVGARYTKSEAKEMLRKIYDDLGYKKSPKATDLGEWFNIKRVYFNDSNGFELIGLK